MEDNEENLSYLKNQNPVTESSELTRSYCSARQREDMRRFGSSGTGGFLVRINTPGANCFDIKEYADSPVVTFRDKPSMKFPSGGSYIGYVVVDRVSPFFWYDTIVRNGVLVLFFHNCKGSLHILRHPYNGPPLPVPAPVLVAAGPAGPAAGPTELNLLLDMLEVNNSKINEQLRDLKLELVRQLSRGQATHLCNISNEIRGEGKSGAVYSAVDNKTGHPLAVKTILLNKGRIDKEMVREMLILLEIDHPNIVRLHYVFPGVGCINLAMEFCDDDISGLISQDPHASSDPMFVKGIMFQVLSGVAFLHKSGILHRDLKPSNILYRQAIGGKVVKLADFGIARMIGDQMTPQVTSLLYRAPEVLLGSRTYTTAVDVWSVGCVFGELVDRSPIFSPSVKGYREHDMIQSIFRKLGCPTDLDWPGVQAFPNYPVDVSGYKQVCFSNSNLDDDGNDLLLRLLSLDPAKRITAAEALVHPYFQNKKN